MPRRFLIAALLLANQAASAIDLPAYKPDGKLEKEQYSNQMYEAGTVNGIPYKVWSDLQAQFGSWFVKCEKDAVTDRKSCYISQDGLWVSVNTKGAYYVSVMGDKFPHSKTYIRLDGGKPLVGSIGADGDFSAAQTAQIAKLLPKAKAILTRRTTWPDNVYEDKTDSGEGYSEALEYTKWALGKL